MKLIYFIDDDDDFRDLVTRVIEISGYRCESFGGLQQALDALERASELPGLVLLDYSVPGLSPNDFIKSVRARPEWAEIGLHLVSGMDELGRLSREAGADGFLAKPFDMRQMKRFLDKVFVSP